MKPLTDLRVLIRVILATLIVAVSVGIAGCGSAEDRKQEHIARGEQFLAEDNLEKARLEFQNALKIDPKDAIARYNLGQVLEKKGDIRAALAQYLAAMQELPTHLPSRIKTAQIYAGAASANAPAKQTLLEKASAALDEAYKLAPEDTEVLVTRAMVNLASDRPEPARSDVEKVLSTVPDHTQAISIKTLILLNEGARDEAVALLERTLVQQPERLNLQRLLAGIYARELRYDEAAQIYTKLVAAEPQVLRNRLSLVALLTRANKPEDAEQVLRDGIAAATSSEDAVNAKLAVAAFERSNHGMQRAEQTLAGYIDADPDQMQFRFALAQLYLGNKQLPEASEALNGIVAEEALKPDGLKARLGLARIAAIENRLDEAKRLLAEVLTENPADLAALETRARIALAEKRYGEAIPDLRSVVRNRPNDADALVLLGQAHVGNKEQDLAMDAFRRAVEAKPADTRARLMLAQIHVDQGKLDEAENLLKAAVGSHPSDLDTMQALARIQFSKGDFQAANESAMKLQEAYPEQALGFYLAGEINRAQKDFAGAAAQFEQAMALAPDAAMPLAGAVSSKLALGENQQVLETLDSFIAKKPDSQQALLMRARVLMNERRFPEAEADFERLIALNPEAPMGYKGKALNQLAQNQAEAAIETYMSGLQTVRVKERLLVDLGLVYERLQRADEAIVLYEDFLSRNPDSQIAQNNLAMLYVTYQDNVESLNLAKDLADKLRESDNPGFLDTVGWVYLKNGDVDAAIAILEKAAAAVSQPVPEFHYHLGAAYAAKGKVGKAKEHLGKAVASQAKSRWSEDAKAVLAKLGS